MFFVNQNRRLSIESPYRHGGQIRGRGLFLALLASVLLLSATSIEAATLAVNNAADNGTGQCTAIKCTLRDAISSAATGDTIAFDPALNGQTISLVSGLNITRDGITITGNLGSDGKPAVTVDAGGLGSPTAIYVTGSNFTLRHLRLSGVRGTYGLEIRAGAGGPQVVVNARVEGNEFTAGGVNTNQNAISVGMETDAADARISNVSIVGNTFLHFAGGGDGVHVPLNGTNCLVENLQIDLNYFSDTEYPVELVPSNGGTNNRIQGTAITRNTFVGNGVPITLTSLNSPGYAITTGNVIAATTIEQNTLVGNMTGGITLTGGGSDTANNQILNTQIINNSITGTRQNSPIVIIAGRDNAQGNHIDGVSIINNTIANNEPDYTAIGGGSGAQGNRLSGIKVTNTIFWNNSHGDIGELVLPGDVSYCITSDKRFAGVNGNIGTDPMLGPLQNNGGPTLTQALSPGSPAINSANDSVAPRRDQRGYARQDTADIGAFELNGIGPPAQPLNISTRMEVLSDNNVLIAGFIVTGPEGSTKKVMIRGLGPSLAKAGVTNFLADPYLELHASDGSVITTNDNWKNGSNSSDIPGGFQPSDPRESVIIASLPIGSGGLSGFTAILKGANGETGIGLAEAYDLDQSAPNQFANISTRGFVDTGDNVMIAGFILGGSSQGSKVLIRAIGPSLPVSSALADPTLELHDSNGNLIRHNDNWKLNDDAAGQSQEAAIRATTIPPNNDLESAILDAFMPGAYTAIVAGKGRGTGIGLVEVYNLAQ